jgi:hypothetical protein
VRDKGKPNKVNLKQRGMSQVGRLCSCSLIVNVTVIKTATGYFHRRSEKLTAAELVEKLPAYCEPNISFCIS